MKILICGLGSIGKRHANNLLDIGKKELIFFREKNLNLNDPRLKKIKSYNNLKEAFLKKPQIAFICNTTNKHIETAITCAKNGLHLFIEKPLSNNLKKINQLEKIIKKKKLKIMIGYNMRFHPLMTKIKKMIDKNFFGKIYSVKTEWSEYLPDWHPWEDYKSSYAANKKLGGGCSLTLSHELDSLYWLFGKIKTVYNFKTYNLLKINVDSVSDFLIKFQNNVIGYSHIDYLQKPYVRKLEIIGTLKKLYFNYYKNQFLIINRLGKIKKLKIKFKRNDMYVNEIKYFINCIKYNKNPTPSLKESKYLLKKFNLTK